MAACGRERKALWSLGTKGFAGRAWRLCQAHFKPEDVVLVDGKARIRFGALPALHMALPAHAQATSSVAKTTNGAVSSSASSSAAVGTNGHTAADDEVKSASASAVPYTNGNGHLKESVGSKSGNESSATEAPRKRNKRKKQSFRSSAF